MNQAAFFSRRTIGPQLCLAGLAAVVGRGVALVTMAILSTGLGVAGTVGGAIFLASDPLMALRSFAPAQMPADGFWIMLACLAGQTILAVAVIRRVKDEGNARREGA
ncbi:hypothetical protein AUR04nite_31370 [Glutamicibacter uratoxydans]|uniref:Uncharacterized protein n=1 Tax=Glutamicibacter uratoxydans TaxID=43667 RepID=A0A4Y4DVH3_GLUUR|nr:hypothetical protein [Glutamicibacter uratoxydans]GED07605.1 hypothetical protein AUR04nite_31370 [Glutamicibacter uratoxydans]